MNFFNKILIKLCVDRMLGHSVKAFLMSVMLVLGGLVLSGVANALTVQNSVNGLPPGLEVHAKGSVLRCGQNGPTTLLLASVQLVAQTITTLEPIPQPGGLVKFQAVTRTTYTGAFGATLPDPQADCSFTPRQTFRVSYVVVGQTPGGSPIAVSAGNVFSPVDSALNDKIINFTVDAATRQVLDTTLFGNPVTSTSNARNQQNQRWSISYEDEMGAGRVSAPSLELTQPGINILGFFAAISRMKMWITEHRSIIPTSGSSRRK